MPAASAVRLAPDSGQSSDLLRARDGHATTPDARQSRELIAYYRDQRAG
ncbi:hypothetical protein [Actinoplanes sp. NPDC020271]